MRLDGRLITGSDPCDCHLVLRPVFRRYYPDRSAGIASPLITRAWHCYFCPAGGGCATAQRRPHQEREPPPDRSHEHDAAAATASAALP